MFAGIIDHTGRIEGIDPIGPTTSSEGGRRFRVRTDFDSIELGESIAVDGVCLTAVEPKPGHVTFDLSPETLARSALGTASVGDAVNLERALRVGDRLGGHWVTGHVDTTAIVASIETDGEFRRFRIAGIARQFADLRLQKGSIAVNGVSLTINGTDPDSFWFTVIPHTWERTNLGRLAVDSPVNLEFDWMVKAVIGAARRPGGVLGPDPSY